MMVVHWHLTFLWQGQVCFPMPLYGSHTFIWAKCWELQTTSPLKPQGQYCSDFMWNLLGVGEQKIAKMVMVHWPEGSPCPYMVKTFKNLLLQNQASLEFWSLQKSWGMGGLPKLLKWWSYVDIWPFLQYPHVFVWSLYIYMGKCWEFMFWTCPLKAWSYWAETWCGASGCLINTK